jgi:hypothetical protein
MPGPVSDSYDPEFGTAANAGEIIEAVTEVRDKITAALGTKLHNILDVVRDQRDERVVIRFNERELRIIRFCLDRAKESV